MMPRQDLVPRNAFGSPRHSGKTAQALFPTGSLGKAHELMPLTEH